MANNILLISWIGEVPWGYNYLLVIILLLIISILLYRIRKLQKTIKKTNHSYRFSFDILDNLPFPIFVKDITNDFRYYYWNKESAVQSGISSEEAIGHTDYEIYGEERGEKYRNIDKELVQEGKVYRKEEKYITPDGITHDTINLLFHGKEKRNGCWQPGGISPNSRIMKENWLQPKKNWKKH